MSKHIILNACPVCRKLFIAAPYHVYFIGYKSKKKLVCSYTCMIEHEKKGK